MTKTAHPELSRPYFEREARFGRRVIFQWTPSKRWAGPCPTGPFCLGPAECPICRTEPYIEGMVFEDEAAAQAFDLDRLGAECEEYESDHQFDTWERAEAWLRGGR